jgi:hypothetical protein
MMLGKGCSGGVAMETYDKECPNVTRHIANAMRSTGVDDHFISKLKTFQPEQHFRQELDTRAEPILVDRDNDTQIRPKGIHLAADGTEAVAKYYEQKYEADIRFPDGDLEEFAQNIEAHLKELRTTEGDVRSGFFLGATASHGMAVSYIKENGKEALIVNDTMGPEYLTASIELLAFKALGIPVYASVALAKPIAILATPSRFSI